MTAPFNSAVPESYDVAKRRLTDARGKAPMTWAEADQFIRARPADVLLVVNVLGVRTAARALLLPEPVVRTWHQERIEERNRLGHVPHLSPYRPGK